MRIEDRDEFVDLVAQAVVDRIEERDHVAGLVDLVVGRVLALQQEQTQAKPSLDSPPGSVAASLSPLFSSLSGEHANV